MFNFIFSVNGESERKATPEQRAGFLGVSVCADNCEISNTFSLFSSLFEFKILEK